MNSIKTIALTISLLIFLPVLISCNDKYEVENTRDSNSSADLTITEPVILSYNEKNNEILHMVHSQFEKPLASYPIIELSMASYQKDGLLYRNGVGAPFTGQVIKRAEDGSISMRTSYYEGIPHGKMERLTPEGYSMMEAVFVNGCLFGVRSVWWDNGALKEEENWDGGTYKGKKTWDRQGRLIRSEVVPGT